MTNRFMPEGFALLGSLILSLALSGLGTADDLAPTSRGAVQHAMPAGGYSGTATKPATQVRFVYSGPRRFGETRISMAQCAALGGKAHVPAATSSPCASGLACTVAPAFAGERTVCLDPATVATLAGN